MPGPVERRPHQVVHGGVGDDEILGPAGLAVKHPRQQQPAGGHHRAARLQDQLQPRAAENPAHGPGQRRGIGHLGPFFNTPAPAHVGVLQVHPARGQLHHEGRQPPRRQRVGRG